VQQLERFTRIASRLKRKYATYAFVGALATILASGAWAQQSQNADEGLANIDQLTEIVVTAQRKTERAQDVPISMLVLSEEEIAETGIRDMRDMAMRTPGVDMSIGYGQPGNSVIVIRGVTPIGGGQTTGLYIDDVPVTGGVNGTSFPSSPEPLVDDTARIEVLKGPQGALYGDSSMGGAIKFVYNAPDPTSFYGHANVEGATTEGAAGSQAFSGTINAPLSDKTAVRASVSYGNYGGYLDNVSPVTRQVNATNVNDYETLAARVAFAYTPDDTFSIVPAFLHQHSSTSDSNYSTSTIQGVSVLAPAYVSTAFLGPYQKETFQPEWSWDDLNLATLNIQKNFAHITFKSTTGYFDRNTDEFEDLTTNTLGYTQNFYANVYPYFLGTMSDKLSMTFTHQWTQEFRLASSDDNAPLTWVVGTFFSDQRIGNSAPINNPGLTANIVAALGPGTSLQTLIPYALPNDLLYTKTYREHDTQQAAYADVDYKITDALKVTAGARVFRTTQGLSYESDGFEAGGPSSLALSPTSFHGVDPRFVVDYKLSADNLLYASASKGYRPGVINFPIPANICSEDFHNLGISSAPMGANPDSLWNYEVGSKNQFIGNRLQINGSAYDMEWKDIQLYVGLPICGYGYYGNTGSARLRGGDLDFAVEVIKGLTVSASGSYSDAHLTGLTPGLQTPYQVGDKIPFAPTYMASTYLEYARVFGNSMRGFARVDYTYHGSGVTGPSSSASQPGYIENSWDNTNLNIGAAKDKWEARIFVRNVFNQSQDLSLVNIWGQYRDALMRPRTYGINLGMKF
jgi:iron complex outermembrane recepter protein